MVEMVEMVEMAEMAEMARAGVRVQVQVAPKPAMHLILPGQMRRHPRLRLKQIPSILRKVILASLIENGCQALSKSN